MTMQSVDIDDQVSAIMHGADLGDEKLKQAMGAALRERLVLARKQNRPLRVYAGYDPSRPDLHIGHAITLRILRRFQDFGHDVIFVIGSFTAQIGDNSDKTTSRPRKTEAEVAAAAQSYAEQCFRILDKSKTTIRFNGDWLSKLSLSEFVGIASEFTVQQFLSRDNIRKRIDRGDTVGLHEFFYALLQGYDAYYLKADVQLGASEQLFNIMAGRKLQEARGELPLICITYPILVGLDGKARMSKTTGNYIGLSEAPNEQFGKAMSVSDETMLAWLKYVTRWSPREIDETISDLRFGNISPINLKKKMAWEIVNAYHGGADADAAQAEFEAIHQNKGIPDVIDQIGFEKTTNIVDILIAVSAVRSRSEGRRLIEGGGVKIDDQVVDSADHFVTQSCLLRVGKRKFWRVVIG